MNNQHGRIIVYLILVLIGTLIDFTVLVLFGNNSFFENVQLSLLGGMIATFLSIDTVE